MTPTPFLPQEYLCMQIHQFFVIDLSEDLAHDIQGSV